VAWVELDPGDGGCVGEGECVDPSGDGLGQYAGLAVSKGCGVEVFETKSDGQRSTDRTQRGQGLRVCRQGETCSYGAAADHSRFTPRPRQVARRHSRVRVVFVVDNDVVEVRDQLWARAGERKDLEVAGQRADGTVQSAPHPVGVVPAAGEAPISGMLPWGPVPRVGCVTDPVDVGAVTLDGVDWPLRGVQWCGVGLAGVVIILEAKSSKAAAEVLDEYSLLKAGHADLQAVAIDSFPRPLC
jgi:hypothetical protein